MGFKRSMGAPHHSDMPFFQFIDQCGNGWAFGAVPFFGAYTNMDDFYADAFQSIQLFLQTLIGGCAGVTPIAPHKGHQLHILPLIGGEGAGTLMKSFQTGGPGAYFIGLQAVEHSNFFHTVSVSFFVFWWAG